MSTKLKKIYSKADIEEAKRDDDRVKNYFARKEAKKRNTVQIRIHRDWHNRIKAIADKENMLMSFMLDSICKHFFKHYQE